ncbi:uncharacterized protein LOC133884348 isoform X2 [Phragmites australis]|uniref:uncharacterized protein LOC133884348 isoform X2 n=1 Tax=Phragmites australis TaxID=29695 RepID=UPI002D7952C4|nr:uncharacterized protein LOC133884348 isoform X2 [Phragmites australis]
MWYARANARWWLDSFDNSGDVFFLAISRNLIMWKQQSKAKETEAYRFPPDAADTPLPDDNWDGCGDRLESAADAKQRNVVASLGTHGGAASSCLLLLQLSSILRLLTKGENFETKASYKRSKQDA